MNAAARLGAIIALVILAADQAHKHVMLTIVYQQTPPPIEVTSYFNLVMVWNQGISFGVLSGTDGAMRWPLVVVALAVTAALLVWLWRNERRLVAVAIGMVAGGAVGNVIDRVRFGAVADFFDFHVFGYHWPAFNIADCAITVGVGLILLDSFLGRREESPAR